MYKASISNGLGKIYRTDKNIGGQITESIIINNYDVMGRPDNEEYQIPVYNINTVHDFTYNLAGQVTRKTFAYNTELLKDLSFFYDFAGRILNTYDNIESKELVNYKFNDLSLVTKQNNFNGTSSEYTYHPKRYWMTDLKIKKGAEVLYRNQYQYDDVGNRSKLIDEYGAETTYTYDGLYRLTGVQGSYYKRSDGAYNTYSYDTTGNRMQYNSMFNDYEYQYATDSNRLLIERSMNGVEILSYLDFQYDANGNTTHKIHHTGLFETGKEEYLWNCENQMVGYRKYSKNLKSHLFDLTDAMDIEYNLAGMRLSKKVIDVKSGLIKEYDSTLYLYEGSEVELELKIKNDGTVSKKDLYYYGLGKKLYSKEFEEDGSTSAEKVYHQDILGNNILLTDTTGGWVEKTTFGPFGDEIASQRRGRSISAPNGYKFTGKERDRESDLDYFGARYLDYNNGRWMKPDVVNGKYVNPQTLNRFLYSRNNPLKFIDPDGLREVTISIFRHAQNNQVTTGRYTISAVGMNEISGKTIERGAKSISSEGKILPIKAGTYSNIQWYPSSKHGMVINFITKDQKDVPMKNVQLHYGKDETWSDGCIIVGKEFKTNSSTFSQQSSMEAVAEIRRFISEVIGKDKKKDEETTYKIIISNEEMYPFKDSDTFGGAKSLWLKAKESEFVSNNIRDVHFSTGAPYRPHSFQ